MIRAVTVSEVEVAVENNKPERISTALDVTIETYVSSSKKILHLWIFVSRTETLNKALFDTLVPRTLVLSLTKGEVTEHLKVKNN